MSEGTRRRTFNVVALAFCALVLAVILIAAFQSGKQVGAQRQQQQKHSARYAADAEEEIRERCLGLIPTFESKCIREVIEATNEHDRSERDVIAQNEMAMWAFGMLVITGLGVALSGSGVWLIWGTLIRTGEIARDTKITATAAVDGAKHSEVAAAATVRAAAAAVAANELQNKMFVAGTRARVVIESVMPDSGLTWDPAYRMGKIKFLVKIENTGNSAAVNGHVSIEINIASVRDPREIVDRMIRPHRGIRGFDLEAGRKRSSGHGIQMTKKLLSSYATSIGLTDVADIWTNPITVKDMMVVFCVSYQLVLNDEWRHTFGSLRIGITQALPNGSRRFDPTLQNIGPFWGETPKEDLMMMRNSDLDYGST